LAGEVGVGGGDGVALGEVVGDFGGGGWVAVGEGEGGGGGEGVGFCGGGVLRVGGVGVGVADLDGDTGVEESGVCGCEGVGEAGEDCVGFVCGGGNGPAVPVYGAVL